MVLNICAGIAMYTVCLFVYMPGQAYLNNQENIMNININRSAVLDELQRQTALLALKNENNETIAYDDDDAERVEPLWQASLKELLQLLLPYAKMSLTDADAAFLSRTSNGRTKHSVPYSALNSAAIVSSLSTLRELRITLAPSEANFLAQPSPIPLDAPVISTILFISIIFTILKLT